MAKADQTVSIKAPNFQKVVLKLRGNAPYVQNKFSKKARELMRHAQEAGSTAKKNRRKEAKDFSACYEESMHRAPAGWCGIPAPAFKAAMVRACKIVGFTMTDAKCSLFVEADGFDADDGTPLVRITEGEPHYCEHMVRVANNTADIRARAMWDPGWEAIVRVRFDADIFTVDDVINLLMRVGFQVGVGEGRPFSTSSCGMGWGTFEIVND